MKQHEQRSSWKGEGVCSQEQVQLPAGADDPANRTGMEDDGKGEVERQSKRRKMRQEENAESLVLVQLPEKGNGSTELAKIFSIGKGNGKQAKKQGAAVKEKAKTSKKLTRLLPPAKSNCQPGAVLVNDTSMVTKSFHNGNLHQQGGGALMEERHCPQRWSNQTDMIVMLVKAAKGRTSALVRAYSLTIAVKNLFTDAIGGKKAACQYIGLQQSTQNNRNIQALARNLPALGREFATLRAMVARTFNLTLYDAATGEREFT